MAEPPVAEKGASANFEAAGVGDMDAEAYGSEDLNNQDACYNMGIEGDGIEAQELEENEGEGERASEDEAIMEEEMHNMEFNSVEEAREFYNEYNRSKGFAIRNQKRVKNAKEDIVRYSFLCNRESYMLKKWFEMVNRKRGHKPVTRCGL
ncbi:hypothetical protein PIB30_054883 [Stylosanthes scabra]|uniref:Protein FAR1-RELATED SEQUENCE n=1 Tax=Stylosanthes scabra TaxID=79078 RepID=A0ABU6ZHL6_9FABA|nr:hypothetical protein [Stylosanthes scabra]